MSHVAAVRGGSGKSLGLLVTAIVKHCLALYMAVSSLFRHGDRTAEGTSFVLLLLISGVLLLFYFLSKKVFIGVTSNAGPEIWLSFKPNVLEAVPIDAAKMLEAVGVRKLIGSRSESASHGVLRPAAVQPVAVQSEIGQDFASPPPRTRVTEGPTVTAAVNSAATVTRQMPNVEQEAHVALTQAVLIYNGGQRRKEFGKLLAVVQVPHSISARAVRAHLQQLGYPTG